jgi:hypothetical protein
MGPISDRLEPNLAGSDGTGAVILKLLEISGFGIKKGAWLSIILEAK